MIKLINTISRYTVALVFIFSGFVKLVDPYGTAYKISDYLESAHILLPFGLAIFGSLLLSITEFVVGINLIFKSQYKKTLKVLISLVVIFTLLTLYVALVDPVQDCGCFGDALVISNWSTFMKNLVLLVLSIELLRNKNYLPTRLNSFSQQAIMGVSFVFALFLAVSALRHLPIIDFRPYNVGTDIRQAMEVPAGEPQDEYETTYYYEKDGKTEEFTEDNYPWQDTTWQYVDSESVLVKKGVEPAIHDFVLNHTEYGDITDEVLNDMNYTFFLVTPKINKISKKHIDDIFDVYEYAQANGYRFLLLTASIDQAVADFTASFEPRLEVCNVDEIQLKTMVRARPGLLIVKEGIIVSKYHHNDIPVFGESQSPIASILTQQERRESRIIVLFLTLVLGAIYYKLLQNKDYSK